MGLKKWFKGKPKEKEEILNPIDKKLKEIKERVCFTYSVLRNDKEDNVWLKFKNFTLNKIEKAKTEKEKKKVAEEIIESYIETLDNYDRDEQEKTHYIHMKAIDEAKKKGLPTKEIDKMDKKFEFIKRNFPPVPYVVWDIYNSFIKMEKEL